jgi:uncharacterized protein with ParB-like and HNH nuclease domain
MPNFLADTIFGENIDENEYRFYIEPKSVSKFLKEVPIRRIPDYQRPYSWTEKNTKTLLEDIENNTSQGKNWFIGTLYTTKITNNSSVSDILDGQQRFTTIQLILKEFTLFRVLNSDWDWEQVDSDIRLRYNDLEDNCVQCLYSNPSGTVVQRFKAEEITNNILKKYILGTRSIDSKNELLSVLEDISSSLIEVASESRTAQTLNKNINLIRKYLKKISEKGDTINEKALSLISFIDTLLNKFWLIEVPLKNADLSLEIFEAINNRGKPLDLIDRLQFKSLILFGEHTTENKQSWKELYIGVEDLISNGISQSFVDNTTFYKTLFRGISGIEQSDNDDIVEYFSDHYLESQQHLTGFFETARKVIKLFKIIQDPNQQNSFIRAFSDEEKVKVVSLLQVVRRSIIESKNTNQLVVSIANNFDFTQEKYLIVQALWNSVRLILLKDVLANDKSNIIRSDFNKLIQYANRDSSIYIRLFEDLTDSEEEEDSKLFGISKQLRKQDNRYKLVVQGFLNHPNEGVLRTSDNNTAKLIQYFIAHLTDSNTLGSYSSAQYAKEELEHIFPRAYRDNWSEKRYTKDSVIEAIRRLHSHRNWRLNIEGLINDISLAEDIELIPYTTAPHATPNRLIEWHGNKIILSLHQNRVNGNQSYEVKKASQYSSTSNLVIPEPNTRFGVNHNDWDYEAIIERSLDITDFITNEIFNRSWDAVD